MSVTTIFRIIKFRSTVDLLYTTLRLSHILKLHFTAKYETNKNSVVIEPF